MGIPFSPLIVDSARPSPPPEKLPQTFSSIIIPRNKVSPRWLVPFFSPWLRSSLPPPGNSSSTSTFLSSGVPSDSTRFPSASCSPRPPFGTLLPNQFQVMLLGAATQTSTCYDPLFPKVLAKPRTTHCCPSPTLPSCLSYKRSFSTKPILAKLRCLSLPTADAITRKKQTSSPQLPYPQPLKFYLDRVPIFPLVPVPRSKELKIFPAQTVQFLDLLALTPLRVPTLSKVMLFFPPSLNTLP